MPRLSIIVLSHRVGELPGAFASAHAQTFKDREIVVKFSEEWHPAKMDDAVRGTSGELFAFLCDDDRLKPTWAAQCVAALDREHADLAYSNHETFGAIKLNYHLPDEPFSVKLLALHCVPHFTSVIRRDLWERVVASRGYGYDGTQHHVDWEWYMTCAKLGAKGAHVRERLWEYQVSGTNSSRTFDDDAAMAALRAKHPEIAAQHQRVRVA